MARGRHPRSYARAGAMRAALEVFGQDQAYRGYLIRKNTQGEVFIQKDGFVIGYAPSLEKARETIDFLVGDEKTNPPKRMSVFHRAPGVLQWARKTLRSARRALGYDLSGYHASDLLLDQSSTSGKYDLTTADVREILLKLGEPVSEAKRNPRERTKNFTRTRVRSPRRFAKGSLRTKVLSGGTELILGHLKGETRRTGRGRRVQVVQAVLVPRKKAKRNPIVAVLNPPIPRGAVEIGRMHLIKYHHTGKDRGYYKHTFKGTERLIGMPDGSLRIIP